jgi:hypothetical protein
MHGGHGRLSYAQGRLPAYHDLPESTRHGDPSVILGILMILLALQVGQEYSYTPGLRQIPVGGSCSGSAQAPAALSSGASWIFLNGMVLLSW